MGSVNIDNTGSGADVTLSSDGTDLLLDGTAVGGALELYAENPSSPTAPSATGANAIAIGDNTTASGEDAVAIGDNIVASGLRSISLGGFSDATGDYSVALGAGAQALGTNAVGIKGEARYDNTTAIGSSSISNRAVAGIPATQSGGATALSGSYASGVDSFAAVIVNNTSSYGATGANSVAMGYRAKATGQYSFAIGENAQATGSNSVCIGGKNVFMGVRATGSDAGCFVAVDGNAQGTQSVVIGGDSGHAQRDGSFVFGGQATRSNVAGKFVFGPRGNFSGARNKYNEVQAGMLTLRCATTDASATKMSSNNNSASSVNQLVLPDKSAFAFHGTLVAREDSADGTDCAAWILQGLIRRETGANTTTLVNSATTVINNAPNWSIALSADTTNGALSATVTGAASKNIRWVFTINTSEVTYA